MSKKTLWQDTISRRALFFGGVNLAMFSALTARLYFLQFIEADDYTTLAEGNRVKLQLIPPVRGSLLDFKGIPLAINEDNYRVLIDVDHDNPPEKIMSRLRMMVDISDERVKEILTKAKKRRYQPPILIKEHLSWEELAKIEYHTLELPGIFIDVGQVRNYRLKEKASHLIGYIGAVAEGEAGEEPLLKLPDFKIGKDGAEKLLEERLRGAAGVRKVEVNVHNLPVRELSRTKSIAGENITTTIDSRLQEYASDRLGEESGAIIVMNVHNGDVLALVSMPAFDPNRFSVGITNAYWKELRENVKNPLLNKAIAGVYPPGSTFKMITGLAALEAKVAGPDSRVFCPGHFFLGNHRFNCWKPEGHGWMNLHDALAQSCDTYFYTMGQRMGIDRIAETGRKFGFGSPVGIGLPGEKPGIMPDKKWKQKRYKQEWQAGDTVNVAIGQGYVITTPLQLAVMTARIANGGRAVVPRLVADENDTPPPMMDVDPSHLQHLQLGMDMVTNSQSGTAYGKRITDPRLAMAGKTGTAQVRKILVRGRKQESLPWEHRHHALFVGYAPVVSPKYAISVVVEHGGGGSSAAAPIGKDVLEKIQRLDAEDRGIDLSLPLEEKKEGQP